MKRPVFFRIPSFLLRLALGEAADVFLHGQKGLPKKALGLGYQFQYPNLFQAIRSAIPA
jgi:NAD dependent epimerase/dehydratase family enzyme